MTKKCIHPKCKNNAKKCPNGVVFIPFPKPKTQLARCLKWLLWLNRPGFRKVEQVSRNTYVCSTHFVGGSGPSPEFPDPLYSTCEPTSVICLTTSSLSQSKRALPESRFFHNQWRIKSDNDNEGDAPYTFSSLNDDELSPIHCIEINQDQSLENDESDVSPLDEKCDLLPLEERCDLPSGEERYDHAYTKKPSTEEALKNFKPPPGWFVTYLTSDSGNFMQLLKLCETTKTVMLTVSMNLSRDLVSNIEVLHQSLNSHTLLSHIPRIIYDSMDVLNLLALLDKVNICKGNDDLENFKIFENMNSKVIYHCTITSTLRHMECEVLSKNTLCVKCSLMKTYFKRKLDSELQLDSENEKPNLLDLKKKHLVAKLNKSMAEKYEAEQQLANLKSVMAWKSGVRSKFDNTVETSEGNRTLEDRAEPKMEFNYGYLGRKIKIEDPESP